jgi:hypothetical protein
MRRRVNIIDPENIDKARAARSNKLPNPASGITDEAADE